MVQPPRSTCTGTHCPYTTLFRSARWRAPQDHGTGAAGAATARRHRARARAEGSCNCEGPSGREETRNEESGSEEARCEEGRSDRTRSEEHTSELQSIMRISYAALCLKKTNKQNQQSKPIPI